MPRQLACMRSNLSAQPQDGCCLPCCRAIACTDTDECRLSGGSSISRTVALTQQGEEASEDELQREWDRKEQWYARAVNYWDQQAATVDGVLGGFGHVSPADIRESERFLLKVTPRPATVRRRQNQHDMKPSSARFTGRTTFGTCAVAAASAPACRHAAL